MILLYYEQCSLVHPKTVQFRHMLGKIDNDACVLHCIDFMQYVSFLLPF